MMHGPINIILYYLSLRSYAEIAFAFMLFTCPRVLKYYKVAKQGTTQFQKCIKDHKTQNSGKNNVLLHAKYSVLNRLKLQVEQRVFK